MKIPALLAATLLAFGLAACDDPAEQEEPEQQPPETEATMQRSPDTQPVDVDTGADIPEKTASELGDEPPAEDQPPEEDETPDEPPPQD